MKFSFDNEPCEDEKQQKCLPNELFIVAKKH